MCKRTPTSPKIALNFSRFPINGKTKTYMLVYTSFEWAMEFISTSKKKADLAIGRLTGCEILEIVNSMVELDGGLLINFGVRHEDCLARNVVVTKEEVMKIYHENCTDETPLNQNLHY